MDSLKGYVLLNAVEDNENWFYGGGERNDRKRRHEMRRERKVKRSLLEESLGCFSVYKRQNEALAKCEHEGPTSRIFAFEHSIFHKGRRRYLVTTVERFWHWYKSKNGVSFYELIPPDRPVRLYFDLEFYRETNPDIDEQALIKDFNDCISEVLMEMFNISLNPEKDMLVLDASTISKFSEHIIIHLPNNYLFPSNLAIKSFTQRLEDVMIKSNRCLVWKADATKMVTLFDPAVYSLNRNFRLYLSSKLGKNNPFVLSKRCRLYAHGKFLSRQQIFLDSLIVPVNYNNSGNLLCNAICVNGEYAVSRCINPKILPVPAKVQTSNDYVDYLGGYGATSPYPVLDQHIVAINRRWKDNATIRQWKLSRNENTKSRRITYYIMHCRYCFNVGREHRSNGIFWVVDLDKLHCFQRCFDIDCRGTSSNYFPLPNYVCLSIPTSKDLDEVSNGSTSKMFITAEEAKVENDDNLSKELLFHLLNEAKIVNESEVQKRLRMFRRQSAVLEVNALKNCESSIELTDEELLEAFAD